MIGNRTSDFYIYLALEEKRQVDNFNLQCAVQAVSKMLGYRDLQLRAGFDKPPLTEKEAVEIMIQTFQDYKNLLSFEAKANK